MLAFICAAGPVRQQGAKTHYELIMLEISMTALFMPKVLTPFACLCVYFLWFISGQAQEQSTK